MATIKRKCLTLEQKVEVLKLVEEGGLKKCHIAEKFGIPKNSLSTIIKNKSELLKKFYERSTLSNRKRFREAAHEDVENALFEWFKTVRCKNVPINGSILKEKALDFAKRLGKPNFYPGNSWLQRFKDRHGIVLRAIYGESVEVDNSIVNIEVDNSAVSDWLNSKEDLLKQFKPSNIYNANETGVFYQLLPDKTFEVKGQFCRDGKHSKMRLTALLCSNMDGSDKRKILVVGRYRNPRCLKKYKNFPVLYRANKNEWMTPSLFGEWLQDFDKDMSKQGRKILLLIDSRTAHTTQFKLNSITVCHFPLNITSNLQPMDMGIIKCLKVLYRSRILRRILLNLENDKPFIIDIKTACDLLDDAWRNVRKETIQNCWKRAGFLVDVPMLNCTSQEEEKEEGDLWENLCECGIVPKDLSLDDYIFADANVMTEKKNSDDDIIAAVLDKTDDSVDELLDENEDSSDTSTVVTTKTAIESLQNLRTFFEAQDIDCSAQLNALERQLCASIFMC